MKQAIMQFLQEQNISFQENKLEKRFYEIFYCGEWLTLFDFNLIRIIPREDAVLLDFSNSDYCQRIYQLNDMESFKTIILKLKESIDRQKEVHTLLEEALV